VILTQYKLKFISLTVLAVLVTLFLAAFASRLLFSGKNSLKVYTALKEKKEYLQYNITRLQRDNARLQKEYFELKNLEPEE